MTATNPGSFAISALLHAAVLGLVLFFSYAATSLVKDEPKVFELVAGAGDNYMATEAPALGGAGTVKVTPLPKEPTPPHEAAAPVAKQEAPPIQSAPEAKPREQKPVDLLKSLKRAEARREAKLEAQFKKEQEAERKREEALAKKQARLDAEGIASGVIGGSTANKVGGAGGKALSAEEGRELDRYLALLKSRIKENHIPPEGVSNSLVAQVKFMLSAGGAISDVRIASSSGNADFDRSVVEACRQTHSIGPRPDHRDEEISLTFKMQDE